MVWQWMLKNWLRQRAAQAVTEEVLRAATAAAEPNAAPGVATVECHVAVLGPSASELGCFQDRLSRVTTVRAHGFTVRGGKFQQRNVLLVETGRGATAAAQAARAVIDAHRPWWLVSADFAAALSDDLTLHELLVADEIVASRGPAIPLPAHLSAEWLASIPRCRRGRLLSLDEPPAEAEVRRGLGQRYRALAADQAAHAVAEVCQEAQTPFLAVRAIRARVEDRLPRDVERLLGQKSAAGRFGALLGSLVDRPGSMKDLYHHKETSLIAADRLADLLAAAVLELVPAKTAEANSSGAAD